MMRLPVVRTVAALREAVAAWRGTGEVVGLVPTMGALHEGHMRLVDASLRQCGRTVATLFVNPRQFGANEDFSVYPRTEEEDRGKLDVAGVDLLYAPDIGEMYPDGFATEVSVGTLGEVLEGAYRPGFFTGVATVVTKLLLQAGADTAFFGEKDYQQLQVIRRLVRDLDIPVKVVGVETVRERDGLALSSRNAYLGADERRVAPALFRALESTARRVSDGEAIATVTADETAGLRAAGFCSVDYIAVVDAVDLSPLDEAKVAGGDRGRVLGAAKLGTTRLIDNLPLR